MSVAQNIKNAILRDTFDPFDFSQISPPEHFGPEKSKVDLSVPINPFEGFGDAMRLLTASLERGIEIYGQGKK